MRSVAANKALCHASTLTSNLTTSHINDEMTCRQHQALNQSNQQCKAQQKYRKYSRNEIMRFQFRIVMMPHSLQMRLLVPTNSLLATLLLVAMVFVVTTPPVCQAVGYSYSRFSGPVTGPEQKIVVHDGSPGGGGGPRVDYIAKPSYEFAYGIEDAQARLLQNRQETRDGDAVRGSYSVVEPDGNLRVVKYTADHLNGFQAEVTSNDLNTVVHGQQAPAHAPPTPLWYYPHTSQHQVQHPQANSEQKYNEDNNNYDESEKGDYEVNEDYDEESDGSNEKRGEHKESHDESGENYNNDDEHEDYDANSQSAETSKEATSYGEQSEEYY